MSIISQLTVGFRFLVEICAIVFIGIWSFQLVPQFWLQVFLCFAIPAIIIIIWSILGSPAAPYKLDGIYHIFLECFIYFLASLALWQLGLQLMSLSFFIIAVANRILLNYLRL